MSGLRLLWREHRIALMAFLVAIAVTLFFAARFVAFTLYWSDPAHRNQAPEGWMTPGYVARSWQVPREDLFLELDLPTKPDRPRPLADIAAERGVPLPVLLDEVARAVAALRNQPNPR